MYLLLNYLRMMTEDLKEEDLLNLLKSHLSRKLLSYKIKNLWEDLLRLKFQEKEIITNNKDKDNRIIDSRLVNQAKSLRVLLLEIYHLILMRINFKSISRDVVRLDLLELLKGKMVIVEDSDLLISWMFNMLNKL